MTDFAQYKIFICRKAPKNVKMMAIKAQYLPKDGLYESFYNCELSIVGRFINHTC